MPAAAAGRSAGRAADRLAGGRAARSPSSPAGCAAATSGRCRSSSAWSSSGASSRASTASSCPPATSSTSRCRAPRSAPSRIGIVLVLLLGEIDLSVGSVSGLAAAIMGVALTHRHWPLALAVIAAILTGAVIGLPYGVHLHPVRRAELRHHPGRPARLPRPAAVGPRQGGVAQHPLRPLPSSSSPSSSSWHPSWPTAWWC